MNLLRVRIPVVQFVPLRRAEPEQVLAMDVFGRGDELLAEAGTELDDEVLTRFDNFGVRQIVVEDYIQRWIRTEERDALPSGANVLGRETVHGPLEDLLDMILDAILPGELREAIRYVLRRASLNGMESARLRLQSLADRATSLMDDFSKLRQETEELENQEARSTILELLDGLGLELGYTLLDQGVKESLMKQTVRAVNQREQIRSDLIQEVREWEDEHLEAGDKDPDPLAEDALGEEFQSLVQDLNDGSIDRVLERVRGQAELENGDSILDLQQSLKSERDQYSSLIDDLDEAFESEPMRRQIAGALDGTAGINPKTLTVLNDRDDPISQQLLEFISRRFQDRAKLWSVLNEATDGKLSEAMSRSEFFARFLSTPEEEPTLETSVELGEDNFDTILEETRKGNYLQAAQSMIEQLGEDLEEGSRLEGQLIMAGESFEKLQGERQQLRERVRSEVPDGQQEDLISMLENPQQFDSERLLELDADMVLLESVESYVQETRERVDEFVKLLRECAPSSRSEDVEIGVN